MTGWSWSLGCWRWDFCEWDHFDRPARGEIGKIAKRLIERRQSICVENEIGLTDLYNQVDDGA